jgi:hypothetical protein
MPVPIPSNAVKVTSVDDLFAKLVPGAVLDARGITVTGRRLEIVKAAVYGVRVTGLKNQRQAHNAAIIVRGGKLFNAESDNHDGAGVGVFGDDSIVAACHVHHCGHDGIAVSSTHYEAVNGQPNPASDNRRSIVAYNHVHDINRGLQSPVWAGQADTVNKNGLWFVVPGWEAQGIGKFAGCRDALVAGNLVHDIGGVGIWGDVYGYNTRIKGNRVFNCFGVVQAWEGMGISNELMFLTEISGNHVTGCTGSSIQTAESADVTIDNNLCDNIELRALTGRTPGHRNVTVTNNRVTRGIGFSVGSGSYTNAGNIIGPFADPGLKAGPEHCPPDLTSLPGSGGPSSDPPPDPSPDALTDAAGDTWEMTDTRQIKRNGVVLPETNNVNELRIVNGVLWQRAHNVNWYSRTATGWKAESGPPVVDPDPPPGPVPDELNQALAALAAPPTAHLATKAALDLSQASGRDLQGQLDAARGRIAVAVAALTGA